MHRIPDLQEHFVMMDDDWFFLRKMSPSDFFSKSGRPQYAIPVTEDSLVEMYGPPKDLHGLQTPPEHVPDRLESFAFTHRALPMTVNFSMHLEEEFGDWFAFVRSHKTRFVCCNSSTIGNGLDELFHRMYPAMLYKLRAGDQLPGLSPETEALYGDMCVCNDMACIERSFAVRGSIALQSCGPQAWPFVENLLIQRMDNADGMDTVHGIDDVDDNMDHMVNEDD